LSALEKIPGVGSLRSSSVGSSLPSLNLEQINLRSVVIKREDESSHSLCTQASSNGGQVGEYSLKLESDLLVQFVKL
jgi:hypothetical protein